MTNTLQPSKSFSAFEKNKIEHEKRALLLSTMPGGLIGGYIEPDFPFYFVNSRMLEYLGYDNEEEFIADLNGLIANGIHPDDRDTVNHTVEQQLSLHGQYAVDYRMRKKDGQYIWVHDIGKQTVAENGKPVIISVCYDITEQIQQAQQLRANERALAAKYELEKKKPTLGDKALLFHAIFNLNSGKTLEYEYSDSKEILTGDYSTFASAIAMVAPAILTKQERENFLQLNKVETLLNQYRKGNQSFSLDYRRRLPNGRNLWVRNVLRIVPEPTTQEPILFEYCYDIHDQKMIDEVLHTITSYDYDRLSTIDFKKGEMRIYHTLSNGSEEKLASYDSKRRHYANTFVVPKEREAFLQATDPQTVMKRVAEQGSFSFTTTIKQGNSEERILTTRYIPYNEVNGIYIMTRTDVTELLREKEKKNAVLNEALVVAQQANQAKSNFLADMSHDIRTPMNAIVGMCEIALADETNYEQVHECLQTIQSSSSLLQSLINNVLDMSRMECGTMVLVNQPFSIIQEVQDTAATCKVLATQKEQHFQLQLNVKHDRCIGDASCFHRIVNNILSNAVKYTPIGGTIIYKVTELPSERANLGLYRIEISDTGIGISAEQQEHLFDPFYRGKRNLTSSCEGVGIGLSIVKAMVDLKGGTISIKSREGEGATFVVEMPFSLADKDDTLPERLGSLSKDDEPDLSHLHILVCEDHPVNQKVVVKILEKTGSVVTIAQNGREGVNLFLSNPPQTFDLILMDIQMPEMNGYQAARAIRESKHPQAQQIPIIAMTANAFAEDVQKTLDAGMNAHLGKPILSSLLYETILKYVSPQTEQSKVAKEKVLFVDDVELNIAVLTAAIDGEYEVFVARNGEEALTTLKTVPGIVAVITDIIMPGIDGITLIKAIRSDERYHNVAVLANTQYGGMQQEAELRALGADDFLYKPTTPKIVLQHLKAALHKYTTGKSTD